MTHEDAAAIHRRMDKLEQHVAVMAASIKRIDESVRRLSQAVHEGNGRPSLSSRQSVIESRLDEIAGHIRKIQDTTNEYQRVQVSGRVTITAAVIAACAAILSAVLAVR